MAIIGKRNRLAVARESAPGIYLDDGEGGEILLPVRYIPAGGVDEGDVMDVFVYLDSEDRRVATTETPLATAGDFACLKVVSLHPQIGAFLDWGLAKDLLLPFREQVGQVNVGDKVIVYILVDTKTSRMIATMRVNKHLSKRPSTYKEGDPVDLLITNETPLGYNAIVENAYAGLLYRTNLSGKLQTGQKVKGFVHQVRSDGKIDLRLDASGYAKVSSLKDDVLQAIQRNGGRLELDDKTSPEIIREKFGVSKNAFKMALSALYKKRLVIFRNGGTELVKTR